MTYYEWVMLFDKIKSEESLDTLLNELSTYETVSYEGNANTLFVNHIVDVINTRIKNSITNFINKSKYASDVQSFQMEINALKKQMTYLKKFISYDYVPDNKRAQIHNYLNSSIKKLEQVIKDSFKNNTNNDYSAVINNLNLMEEKL